MVNFAPGQEGEILAACVKNRFAKCDPTGKTFMRMKVNPQTSLVTDWTPTIGVPHQREGGEWWQ
jgi:hypothetical protein